jgi:alkanesulfonate monooxygenase SsuD/methylene tetrahydromethanopterin reductase-like flavin-dependent oxidoreductase (luciferase family)
MRYGVVLFTSDRGITPARAAQAAEAAGFERFYVPEHTHIPVRRQAPHPRTGTQELPDDRYLRTLDPWVALSTAAAVTSTIGLGTAVALPAEHDPISLAKTVASLDHLSGGRVVLGAGFGWNLDELADHGVPAGRRRAVLREYLEAVQQPRVPILVGAGGTEKTFAWIARSADGWLTTPGETDLDAKLALLTQAWRAAGRTGQPQVTVLAGRPDPDLLAHWAEIGVTDVTFGMPDRAADEVVAYLARLAARLGLTRGPSRMT